MQGNRLNSEYSEQGAYKVPNSLSMLAMWCTTSTVGAEMPDTMTESPPYDLPQLHGRLSDLNYEEGGAYKASSLHSYSVNQDTQDTHVLNDALGKHQLVEPSGLWDPGTTTWY
jgi:hypothetical protein